MTGMTIMKAMNSIACILGFIYLLPAQVQASEATGETHPDIQKSIQVSAEIAEDAGLGSRPAGPGQIERSVISYGRLIPNPDAIAHVRARFNGEVKAVTKGLGDAVKKGEVLATIESNQSLKPYPVRAPIAGTITARHITVGELTENQELFALTNLNILWAELRIFPGQRALVARGQRVLLDLDGKRYESSIRHLLPGPDGAPYVIAHVEMDNTAGLLSPGRLVSARIVVETIEADLAIASRALQQSGDEPVAFVQNGDNYERRELRIGRRNGQFVEVLTGLEAGEYYVVDNSYLLKAELEKSGASHAH